MLESLCGIRFVENLLEGGVDTLSLPDLLDGAAVVPRIRRRRLLGAVDERLHRGEIGQTFVAIHVLEDLVEQSQCRTGSEEVLHIGVPRTIKTGDEREPC